jgi:nicotinamide mononucleotide (NMN) deamidase PncC
MTDAPTRATLERLFDSRRKLVYEFTGAGGLALAWLHSVGGSSRLLLEACDRYSHRSLAELLGRAPAKPVSAETAAAMAHRAYRRAVRLSEDADAGACVGLACTATIASDRAKRGEHACHVAVHDRHGRAGYGVVLRKGERDRLGEETFVAQLILHALADACGVESQPAPQLVTGEEIIDTRHHGDDPVHLLLENRAQSVMAYPDGRVLPDEPFSGALLSGSFNPLHCGHETLLRVATAYLRLPGAYELPVVNADKPPLPRNEIERRVAQFRRWPAVLTRVPLFRQKVEVFPGCTFVVGYDTAVRLVDPRYYGGAPGRDAALDAIRACGCRFLVAARPMPGEGVRTLTDVPVPPEFADMFVELPRSEFMLDLSSTELREQG